MFWFDGGALIGKLRVSEGALAWRPTADGAHLIRVIDDHGRAAERDVQVQFCALSRFGFWMAAFRSRSHREVLHVDRSPMADMRPADG